MRQKAIVVAAADDGTATVEVLRSTMCDGCKKSENGTACACGQLFGAAKTMRAAAVNEADAEPGDCVEIETESSVVLGYAALVFLFPIAAAFLLYTIAVTVTEIAWIHWGAAAAGFVFFYAVIAAVEQIRRTKMPQIRIVSVLHRNMNNE